ncbi:MAG: glycolate oxidase subunit GlcE [Gammaproteobacteria bacterium]|nr:glycolate oxidase subunit GlcE [Gammaproteobacteria bacterium]
MTLAEQFAARIADAHGDARKLRIEGGGSKRWLGHAVDGETLSTRELSGIVAYEPSELVVTACAGTPLTELQQVLDDRGQMLPFEPPLFGDGATLGGVLACGLSGPRRPYAGAARDLVLGTRIVNGKGELLRFGGQVMKNVAGYDVSRLMVGAQGTLGVIVEASIKVLPKPEIERTVMLDMSAAQAIETMNRLAGQPLPLSAAMHDGDLLYLRLSGYESGVASAMHTIGGEEFAESDGLWLAVREHLHPFFDSLDDDTTLWRLSVPATTPPLDLPGSTLIDWGGAQRWFAADLPAATVRDAVAAVGGHATLYRPGPLPADTPVFHPLSPAIARLHAELRKAFDPAGILNPGRLGDA